MAPNYPDEVDVFTVPHSRMKQLVHRYLDLVSATNFSDAGHMTSVLEKLCHTFHVFKTHEQIENRFIMRRLKEKLIALDITDAAVCNCHSDNRLTEMISMVLDGYRWAQHSESERIKYGQRLRHALEDFTQIFLPHMKEEEEGEEEAETSPMEQLPAEVMIKVMSYLSPKDLCRCAQVSQHWNQVALDPCLWPGIYPVQWAAGDWSFHPETEEEDGDEETAQQDEGEEYAYLDDEDADRDESSDSDSSDSQDDGTLQRALCEVRIVTGLVKYVLPRVGAGVELCNLSYSRGISSSLVHKILKLCPNLTVLKLAHTKITDAAFKEYAMKGGPRKLKHLDLSGCENITDSTLHSLAGNHQPSTTESRQSSVGCCGGRGNQPNPTTIILPSSPDRCVLENNPVIERDPSLTDLPLELCSFDCLNISIEGVPAGSLGNSRSCSQSCRQTTDIVSCCSVKRTCCSSSNEENRDSKTGCCGQGRVEQEGCEEGKGGETNALRKLNHLSLNSCYRVTDDGMRALSERGGLPLLRYLDLSGCLNLTGEGVAALVDTCQSLDHAFLFYCDNVYPDPFPSTASGCRNLECSARFCCRSGD